MKLSPHMLARLQSYVEAAPADRTGRRWDNPLVGDASRWFCPACGTSTELVDSYLTCTECGGVLNDYVYELFEMHQHRDPNGPI